MAHILSDCENCEGCNTAHLSQTHHACLSMGKFKRLEYFDAALQRTSEAAVVTTSFPGSFFGEGKTLVGAVHVTVTKFIA